jgi:small subunit ribosomal protein S20
VASHKSAIKAHKQNIKRRDHNRAMRTRMRGVLREIRAAIDKGNPDELKAAVSSTVSLVDKMAGKGLIHRNTAGRYKARLAARLQKRTAATAAA